MCLVNCPFGAIVDKGQIFQTIYAMKEGYDVIAAVAPAFVGQFGPAVTPDKVKAALKAVGFADVVEVAIGADLCTIEEAEELDRSGDMEYFDVADTIDVICKNFVSSHTMTKEQWDIVTKRYKIGR